MSVRCQRSTAQPTAEILSPPALSSHDDCTCQSLCRNVLPDSSLRSPFASAERFERPSPKSVLVVEERCDWPASPVGKDNVTTANASKQYLLNPSIRILQNCFSMSQSSRNV